MHSAHQFATVLNLAVPVYFIAGITVCTIIRVLAQPPLHQSFSGGPLVEATKNAANTLYCLVALISRHPIVFLVEIAFWPFWLVCLLVLRITGSPCPPP
jgi:hypothetical protein